MTHRFVKVHEFTDGMGHAQPTYPYGKTSHARLVSCDYRIIQTFWMVAEHYDVSIICGHRNEYDQHTAFITGKSQVDWPNSRHNSLTSEAIDAALYRVRWDDTSRARFFAGVVLGIAASLGPKYELRWGGDWDSDPDTKNRFEDLMHFELLNP